MTLLIVLIVAGVLLLAALATAVWLWFVGWDVDRFMDPRRAAVAEAGERSAEKVAEFRDWVRLGR